jgi:hypothetical protein
MAQSTARIDSVEALDTVVDADAHVLESVEDFAPYVEDRYSGVRRIVERAHNPTNDIYSSTHSMPTLAEYTDYTYEYAAAVHAGERRDVLLSEMAEFGIDYAVVDPTLNLSLNTVDNRLVAAALANAYNAWILDEMVADEPTLKANLLVAPQKPAEAAEEIDRRGGEEEFVGVFLPATGLIPPPGHEWYDPIYEAAQDHGLPVVLHGGAGATNHAFPTQRRWSETYAEDHVVVHPFSQMWNVTSIMFQGVPERFPDLEFVVQEAGIGWIPYLVWRLDDHYLELAEEIPHLRQLPSAYVEERFTFTTQPLGHTAKDPGHLAKMLELVGPETVMYASDLPHPDFDPPTELFDRVRGAFDADTVRGMMGETAADTFGLG